MGVAVVRRRGGDGGNGIFKLCGDRVLRGLKKSDGTKRWRQCTGIDT